MTHLGRSLLLSVILTLVVLAAALPRHTAARARTAWTAQDITAVINQSAGEFEQSGYWMGRVLYCESGWNPSAYNVYSGAAGIAQFLPGTFWANVGQLSWLPGTWMSPYNPAVAIRTMAYMWNRGYARLWECSYVVGYLR